MKKQGPKTRVSPFLKNLFPYLIDYEILALVLPWPFWEELDAGKETVHCRGGNCSQLLSLGLKQLQMLALVRDLGFERDSPSGAALQLIPELRNLFVQA